MRAVQCAGAGAGAGAGIGRRAVVSVGAGEAAVRASLGVAES
jgi:hypothetical protein